MSHNREFFAYVIPSVLAFALSGVYCIVDGYFVGNSVGDIGLAAINIAYPVTAFLQAIGTGVGMGGAVNFSIRKAEGRQDLARDFFAGTCWLLLFSSILMTALLLVGAGPILEALGASGEMLDLGREYLGVIAWGSVLQIIGTGIIPLIRNRGGAAFAMAAMAMGFLTNCILDYLFVWRWNWSLEGAALATILGQGVAMTAGVLYLCKEGQRKLSVTRGAFAWVTGNIVRIGLAPFGLTLVPNLSLILINRFSAFYGGDSAIACYACISYVIFFVYLILQGVGDGSQPLMSHYYGRGDGKALGGVKKLAYGLALALAALGILVIYVMRRDVGGLLGASLQVAEEVARIFPIFLLSLPFTAYNRIAAAGLYATQNPGKAYVLTFGEPLVMLVFLLTVPRLMDGQRAIWWSTTVSSVVISVIAYILHFKIYKNVIECNDKY